MKSKSRKSGISLISLIITIIVIIILAAVVIFSGMDTPEKAQLSKVISDIDNVQTAVDQAYYGLYTEKAVAGEVWTQSQFYEAVAKGITNRDELTGDTGIIEIQERSLLAINLPEYEGRKWGLALEDLGETVKTGSVLLIPGFVSNGKTYATLLDVQNGGSSGDATSNMGGGSSNLSEEDKNKLANIKIGDEVANYMDVGDGISWRVIDKNDETGEVLITTSDSVGSVSLNGAQGYINIITELDNYCKSNYKTSAVSTNNIRSMTVEDLNRLCLKYSNKENAYDICNVPIDNPDELIKLTYSQGYYGRYIYYSPDTPENLVQDKEITLSDGTVIKYHKAQLENSDTKFLTYDNENGKTYTATSFVKSDRVGDGGYRVPEYENGVAKPAMVTIDAYAYMIPEAVKDIIGRSDYALASRCISLENPDLSKLKFGIYVTYSGILCPVGTYDISGISYSGSAHSIHPVITLNVTSLENLSTSNGTNIWNVM